MTLTPVLFARFRLVLIHFGVAFNLVASSLAVAQQPDTRPSFDESFWQTTETRRAYDALAGEQSDVLVVPFQVESHGLDAASRSLMTISLAHRLATGTGLRVANPVYVAEAFGNQGRQYSGEDIRRIAKQVGARRAVIGKVGHDNTGHLSLRVSMLHFEGDYAPGEETEIFSAPGLEFDDHRLPYHLFLEERDEIVRRIAGDLAGVKTSKFSKVELAFPPRLVRSQEPDSPLADVAYLQALAVLHPQNTDGRHRDLLFERSLVLLEYIGKKSPNYALLKARALLYLNRRPAAIDVLDGAGNPAAKALRTYADGNLPALEEARSKIDEPLLAALAEIEAERLNITYHGAPNRAAAESYIETDEVWGPLFFAAMSDQDGFRPFTTTHLKVSLDAAFPDPGKSLETFVGAQAATGYDMDEIDFVKLLIRHIDDTQVEPSECAGLAPCDRDYLDLLRSMYVGGVVRHVRHIRAFLGKPDDALRFANEYDALLRGHPAFTAAKGLAVRDKLRETQGNERSGLLEEFSRLMRNALWWTQRLTLMTAELSDYYRFYMPMLEGMSSIDRARYTFETDWPRPAIPLEQYTDRRVYSRAIRQCADYTIANFACFREYHTELMAMKEPVEDPASVLERNRNRFVGHPERLRYLASQLEKTGDHDAGIALYQDAVDSGTSEWTPYEVLFDAAVLSADFKKGEDIGLSHPGFADPEPSNRVTLSNKAYNFGSGLYWAGAHEHAVPLYELAAAYGTGSGAQMSSQQRLALVAGDYEGAIYHATRRVRRYDSKYALRDLVGLYAITGDLDTASAIVAGIDSRLHEPEAWIGALIEQRAKHLPVDDIAQWAFENDRYKAGNDGGLLALRHVFLANSLDRQIPESLPETLADLDPRLRPYHQGHGKVREPGHTFSARYFTPRSHSFDMEGRLTPRAPVDRRIVFGARALLALDRGDFEGAFTLLDVASEFYNLNEFLPYYALASAKMDKTRRISGALERMLNRGPTGIKDAKGTYFYASLAKAVLLAMDGEHADAINRLQNANGVILHNHSWLILTRYQIVEIARLLHLETGDSSYRNFALDLARRNAVIEPIQAYTHSFVAMLSDDRDERILALARVLTLDPGSRCLELADKTELVEARKLASDGYPIPAKLGASST